MRDNWESNISIGSIESKRNSGETIFNNYSRGAETTRDAWVYNFSNDDLTENVQRFIKNYNTEVIRWQNRTNTTISIDDFVLKDDTRIKWCSTLKQYLKGYQKGKFNRPYLRSSLYRPFVKTHLYFDDLLIHRRGQFPKIFPSISSEKENQTICLSGVGSNKPFHALITSQIPCLDMLEKTQCFPFYTYDEDGSHRRENITDWALASFREHYGLPEIGKWDIFHYIYGLLHHPQYRSTYQANLRRELPRIPYAPDFWGFADAGKRLAELHVRYEAQPEYPLAMIEADDQPLNWRVEKMKYNREKTAIIYNNFLTLGNIPPEAHDYRLGNRSALDWIVDQYRVKTDKRSGIVNDPNRDDDLEYIVRLIRKIVTVSLETVKIVASLSELE